MSDTAQAWVWQHSRTKGVGRLVLLALAHACPDDTATARMGTAEMVRRANATKGAVIEAVAAAVETGELEIVEPGVGSRAALYRLPGVVGDVALSGRVSRPLNAATGRVSRPQTDPAEPLRSGEPTASDLRSGEPTATPPASGRVSRPLQPQLTDDDDYAMRTRASSKNNRVEGGSERPAPAVIPGGVPEFARPLVDRITASGVIVRWNLGAGEWFTLDAMIQRSGVDMLAAAAVRAAAKTDVSHARYFLAAWRSLPPAPAAGTAPVTPQHAGPNAGPNVVPFDATAPRRSRAQRTADELALILAREAQQ